MSHNTWIHKLAGIGVRPLANTSITPNQITTLRLIAGLAAAVMLAVGEPPWHIYAAVTFILSMLLDRADGQLARITGRTSAWGHTYDLISDTLCNALIFVGLGIGLRNSSLETWAIVLGILAGLGVAAVLWLVMQAEAQKGERAGEIGSYAGFDPDDAMLIIPLAILAGGSFPLLIAASVGAPFFALLMFFYLKQRMKNA